MKSVIRTLTLICFFSFLARELFAQKQVNYDESKVGSYQLPQLLITTKGKKVTDRRSWEKHRRKEVLNLFKVNVYGEYPNKTSAMHYNLQKIDSMALDGKAVSKQIRIYFTKRQNGPFLDMILYMPRSIKTKVPVFLGLNFRGNQSINRDPNIHMSVNYKEFLKLKGNIADEMPRAEQARRWELEKVIARGYGVATAYYGDLEQDHPEGWKTGIRTTLAKDLSLKPEAWSAIGAWAWGLSRMMDYLQTDQQVDGKRIIVTGHSRLGKAALWAGANDERFAAVISNNSGEGGAALSRRWYGETSEIINKAFPHWFISKYKSYMDVHKLPVDQHMLLALVAPRPLYVASASADRWADPKGEFLSARHAEPIYELYGKQGLGVTEMPAPDQPVGDVIAYHLRTGVHDIVLYDWLQYLNFADRVFK